MFECDGSLSETGAFAVSCLAAGVERADPARAVRDAVSVEDGEAMGKDDDVVVVNGERVSLDAFDRVLVLGGGKGSDRVAAALVDVLDGCVDDGAVVVDEASPTVDAGPVTVHVGDHPIPSERGVAGASAVRELADAADASTLAFAVVTGGASALLPAPVDDVSLEALRAVTRDLLEAGASIDEVNAVRKHVSALKGGRLAAAAVPARVVTVALSDVVGDDPAVVGSGPTAPDESTFVDALAVLSRYDVDARAVREHLAAGARGDVPETPGPEDSVFERTSYHVLASARTAVSGVVEAARDRGATPCVLSTTVRGEAREAGGFHAAVAREVASAGDPVAPPAVLVSAGETTVTVRGDGAGGPNQEFVLGGTLELASNATFGGERTDVDADGEHADADGESDDPDGESDDPDGESVEVVIAAVDTDGRDGSTDAAGAVLSLDAFSDREEAEAARDALAANDAYGFLDARGALLRSGATGTNVNDLRVVVVE